MKGLLLDLFNILYICFLINCCSQILKVIKYIRSLFLLVAVLALISHAIIPHDHHIAGYMNGFNESCPLSGERSDHHPFFPAHCHAFNDLAAEKTSPVIIKEQSQTSFVSVVWRPVYIVPCLIHSHKLVEISGKPFPDNPVSDFSPFRAPPSAC
jgi:hypothetical protein